MPGSVVYEYPRCPSHIGEYAGRPGDDPVDRFEPICYYEFGSAEHIMMDAIIAGLWQSIKNVLDWLDSRKEAA